MKHNKTIAVLIPCYNEGITIQKVIADIRTITKDAAIYVYDNGSTDDTVRQAEISGAIVRHEKKRGKGNVVKTMFQDIYADCYVIVDGDDTYDISNMQSMIHKVLYEDADMVIGNRLSSAYFTQNKKWINSMGNKWIAWAIKTLFKVDMKDILTGCRAFSHHFVKTFPANSTGFGVETEMTIFALTNNMKVDFVDIGYRDRPQGSYSKIRFVKDGLIILYTLIKLSIQSKLKKGREMYEML